MRTSHEARLGIRLLLGLQLATSLAGVVLLGRMAPAVEQILTENVYSTEAVEEMLEVLTVGSDTVRFDEALARAKGNITEAEEVTLLEAIEEEAPAALAGDDGARWRVSRSLRELGRVNRASMQRADARASRLGLAGAWAMALLGFVGFLMSLAVTRQVERRLLALILEIDAVLRAARSGDEYRRCTLPEDVDGNRLVTNLNWILDRRGGDPHCPTEDPALRTTLVAVIDALTEGPAVLADADGTVVAVSAEALGQDPTPAQLAASAELPEGWTARDLGDGLRLLLRG